MAGNEICGTIGVDSIEWNIRQAQPDILYFGILITFLTWLLDTSPPLQVHPDGHVAPMDTSPLQKWTLHPR